MRKVGWLLAAIVIAGLGFLGGFGYQRWYGPPAHTAKEAATTEKKILYWVDPMHPQYKSDKPGIAPDCGMALVPVYEGGSQGSAPASPGLLQISAEKQRWIGVQVQPVAMTRIDASIEAVGRVAVDETRVVRVTSRAEGWVEKVFADFTGRAVEKGEPLLTIYSPEAVASQEEYLLALQAKETLSHSTVPGVSHSNDSLVSAGRRRLEYWGLAPADIERLEKTRQPARTITLHAPAAGFVTTRNAFPNMKVGPETELYTITDQSRVWILADVFESDAPFITMKQHAMVSVPSLPNRMIHAMVANILPQVDPQTRTLRVRLEADNSDGLLKPDMFVTAQLSLPAQSKLTVPADAVLDTGRRQIVFVERASGLFEQRAVKPGERFEDRVEIVSGLKPGERVVTSGAFLLDSESQLRSGGASPGDGAGQPAPKSAPAAGHAGHTPAPDHSGHKHD